MSENTLKRSLLASAAILTSCFVTSIHAQPNNRYCNARYGFCVSYPSSLRKEAPPENGDGLRFHDRSGFVLTASGINNASDETIKSEMNSSNGSFDAITYRTEGENWFILSGTKGDKIVYMKVFVGPGSINELVFEYPARLKAKYDRVVTNIVGSFKPGDVRQAH